MYKCNAITADLRLQKNKALDAICICMYSAYKFDKDASENKFNLMLVIS